MKETEISGNEPVAEDKSPRPFYSVVDDVAYRQYELLRAAEQREQLARELKEYKIKHTDEHLDDL